MLWLATRYFSPQNVCEIGTYIGRSTLAISFGGLKTINKVYTCDGTFDCLELEKFKESFSVKDKINAIEKIEYFGKTMSTDMLNTLKSKNVRIDFLFIDGRVSVQDCEILSQILSDDCIILLDDFEGVEKGVSNALLLRGLLKGHILLQPEYNEKTGYRGVTAMMIPANLLTLSRQQGYLSICEVVSFVWEKNYLQILEKVLFTFVWASKVFNNDWDRYTFEWVVRLVFTDKFRKS